MPLTSLRLAGLLALALAASGHALAEAATRAAAPRSQAAPTLDHCSWDRPGADPYMGDVVSAVDRYSDIPPDVRQRIQARMVRRAYDDVVVIKQGSITGKGKYGSTIRDMHFGANRMCRSVSRSGWSSAMQERGLVYCDSGQCILVPTICRNVSRIARAEVADEHIVALPPEVPFVAGAPVGAVPPIFDAPAPAAGEAKPESSGGEGVPSFASASGGGGVIGGGGFGGGVGGGVSGGGGGTSTPPPGTSVPVTPVPEPGTWALMLAGFAATAALARRRAKGRTARNPG